MLVLIQFRPSDLSATVSLAIHASFEFQPILGNGEQLRKLSITVDELLDRSEKDFREYSGVLCASRELTS